MEVDGTRAKHELVSQALALMKDYPEAHATVEVDGTRAKHESLSQALALEQLGLQARCDKEAAEKELTKVRRALEHARRAIDSFRLKLADERAALSESHAVVLAQDESKKRGVLELTATSVRELERMRKLHDDLVAAHADRGISHADLQVKVAHLTKKLAQAVSGEKEFRESAATATINLESFKVKHGPCQAELARGVSEMTILKVDLGLSRGREAHLTEKPAQAVSRERELRESAATATMTLEAVRAKHGSCQAELARGTSEMNSLKLDFGLSRKREAMHAQSARRHLEDLEAVRRVVNGYAASASFAQVFDIGDDGNGQDDGDRDVSWHDGPSTANSRRRRRRELQRHGHYLPLPAVHTEARGSGDACGLSLPEVGDGGSATLANGGESRKRANRRRRSRRDRANDAGGQRTAAPVKAFPVTAPNPRRQRREKRDKDGLEKRTADMSDDVAVVSPAVSLPRRPRGTAGQGHERYRPCYHFLDGTCQRGSGCKFHHPVGRGGLAKLKLGNGFIAWRAAGERRGRLPYDDSLGAGVEGF